MTYYSPRYSSGSDDLGFKAAAFLVTLSLLFGVGCLTTESRQDVARKPPLVNILRERGRRCRINDDDDAELPQDTRLTLVLEDTRSDALDVLIAHDVTVCPDARLSGQNNGWLDTTLRGVYHAADKVVALYDDGGKSDGFLSSDIRSRGGEMLRRVADKISDGQTSDMFAGLYSCGKSCSIIRWRLRDDFDRDTLTNNPQLLAPPLKGHLDPAPAR